MKMRNYSKSIVVSTAEPQNKKLETGLTCYYDLIVLIKDGVEIASLDKPKEGTLWLSFTKANGDIYAPSYANVLIGFELLAIYDDCIKVRVNNKYNTIKRLYF